MIMRIILRMILRSLSGTNQSVDEVLRKMAVTVQSKATGYEKDVSDIYTDRSCYGQISHYLRTHWNPKWQIMLFGGENSIVAHAILYNPVSHTVLVDTFANSGGTVQPDYNTYTIADPTNPRKIWHQYRLQKQVALNEFKQRYNVSINH